MRLFLLMVKVLALPDVPPQVAEHGGVVMVAAPTRRGGLAKLASADDAAQTLVKGGDSGAAPKRSSIIFGQRT